MEETDGQGKMGDVKRELLIKARQSQQRAAPSSDAELGKRLELSHERLIVSYFLFVNLLIICKSRLCFLDNSERKSSEMDVLTEKMCWQ